MRSLPLVLPALFAVVCGLISSSGKSLGQVADTASLRETAAPSLYFPSHQEPWKIVQAEKAGWNQRQLDALVDWAGECGSTSVLILWRGRVLAEKHWGKGIGGTTKRYQRMFVRLNESQRAIEDVASVQKSIVSILVGIAVHRNLLQVDDLVSNHLPVGWSKATPRQESQIKVKHLLSMTSGLTDDLHYRTKPGTRWAYNTAAYAVVRDCLVESAGMSVHELTRKWLMDPIGMRESEWIPRAKSITALNAFGFASSARDLARVGLLMQAEGNWAGKKVLPDDRFRLASLKASQQLRPNYGYLWWLNDPVRLPAAPADTYSANGALGRRVFVSPSLGLVVVRLGDEPKNVAAAGFDREFWRRLIAAQL
ncbi:MAG: serine hydrolase domain-containing protein [Rubripirellula sp.]|jgi:CubicO group peptidase (beta-lactamase class C family)